MIVEDAKVSYGDHDGTVDDGDHDGTVSDGDHDGTVGDVGNVLKTLLAHIM